MPPDPITQITEYLTRALASPVSVEQARAWLTAARAHRRLPLRTLAEHLRANPHALGTPDPRCPISLVRLTHVLHDAGHHQVRRPTCAICGRMTADLQWIGPTGRLCRRCHEHTHTERVCARCGATTSVSAHYTGQRLCADCRQQHRRRQRPACAICGSKPRPGCRRCYPRLEQTCIACGTSCEPRKITEHGPVCTACYLPGHRVCGQCGRVRPIVKRADDDGPDLCDNCYQGRPAVCSVCQRQRPCQRISTGAPICSSCRIPPPRPCARCGRTATIKNDHWPIGAVCDTCYRHIRDHPVACARCGQRAPAIARTTADEPSCGPCADVDITYQCQGCGAQGQIHADHRCHRCLLADRARTLLTGPDGAVSPQLRPLLTALCATDQPATTLMWIRDQDPAAELLGELAASATPITHEILDRQPPSSTLYYLRDMLCAAGILPPRDEPLERLTPWLEQLLAAAPPHHVAIVKPFAFWAVFHRARHRASHCGHSHGTAEHARTVIRHTLDLLSWLDQHHTVLDDLTQGHLDQWLSDRNPGRRIQPFIKWAKARGIVTSDIQVPQSPRAQPSVFLDDHERLDQLDRCLNDDQIPLDLRVAGGITLQFGIMINRITRLRNDDVIVADTDTFLTIAGHQLQLPPKLAALALQLRDQTTTRGTLARIGSASGWLLPGNHAQRPANNHYLSQRLRRHGIQPHAGRNTARITLAGRLPASVLADLTGISITTAVQWTSPAQRDWTDYIAERSPNTAPKE